MSSYIAISCLKISSIPEKEFRRLLGYLSQECLKEYLSFKKIYNGKRNRNKFDLIDMIINGKIKKIFVDLGSDLRFEEATKILKSLSRSK